MILASALLFGSYGIWSKIMGEDFGIYYQGWLRSAIVLLVAVPIMFFTHSYKRVEKEDRKWLLISVGFGVFTQVPLYYAFNNSSIGTSTLIFYAAFVIISYIVGRLFLGETITKVKILAMALAFAGLAITFGISLASFSLVALLLAGINGIASGGEVSTTKKTSHKYSSLQISNAIWLGILITHLPMSLLTGEKQWAPALDANWGAMLAFAAAGLVAFWLVVEGFKYVDASIGSLVGLLEIVFGVIFGALFFGEQLSFFVYLGGLLIIFAAVLPDLSNIIEKKRTAEPVEPPRQI